MQCLKPLLAFMPFATKKIEFIADYDGSRLLNKVSDKHGRFLQIPCGHCINCRVNRANDWKKRILKECELYEHNNFITLTYDELHLPENKSLVKKDVQLFIKKLRKYLDSHDIKDKIKYFCSGEYGDKTRRPHYHMILMNCDLSVEPMEYIKNENDTNYYSSKLIEKCWTNHNKESLGNNIVARVVKETVAYTTKYTIKKQYGPNSVIYEQLKIIPEFMICSKGIGLKFLENNIDNLSECGNMLVADGIGYANYEPLPKYYLKKIKEKNFKNYVNICLKNGEFAEKNKNNILNETSKKFKEYNEVCEEYLKGIYKVKGKGII